MTTFDAGASLASAISRRVFLISVVVLMMAVLFMMTVLGRTLS
jgi:hypothetical protein